MSTRDSEGIMGISLADVVEAARSRKIGDPNAPPPTWQQLVAAEPRLDGLMAIAKGYHPASEGFCANEVWYGPAGLRRQVIGLVGHYALSDDPVTHGSKAYEVAYDALYNALPDCDHEDTMCRWGRADG